MQEGGLRPPLSHSALSAPSQAVRASKGSRLGCIQSVEGSMTLIASRPLAVSASSVIESPAV